jgi:DNA polymerase family B
VAKIALEEDGTPPHLAVWHGVFGPINNKPRTYKIIGFDTEDDTKGTPISFAFHDGLKSFYTTNWEEAIDYVYNYPETAVFLAHNLEYDIGNLFKACNYRYIEDMVYASRLLKVSLIGTRNYFLNTSSFFAGSLAAMAPLVGLKKLDGDVFNPDYNIVDAQIVQVFGDRFQKRLHSLGINMGVSIGQLAMGAFRANFLGRKQVTYNSPRCLEAYYGGRVEMFYKGIVKGPVHVCDINSSYPDVMRRHEYPETSFIEPSSIYTHTYGIGKFTVRVPEDCFLPPLPFRTEGKRLFFPTGDLTGWWTYAEVRYAVEKCGCEILEEFEGEGTNQGCRPFSAYIDHFYDQRIIAKRKEKLNPDDEDAKFESLFLKLLMNNLYGKFGQHKPSSKMTRVRMSPNELAKLAEYKEHQIGPFYCYTIPRDRPPKTANYLWGVYVTTYARLSLHEKMQRVHDAGSRLIYCDTDSIMFSGDKGLKALDIGDKLGQMGAEKYDLGIFRHSKGYLLCDNISSKVATKEKEFTIKKVACKGVPTRYALEFIMDGMVEVMKPMRLKEGIIRLNAKANQKKGDDFLREIGVNVWREVEKTMKSIYIKRRGEQGVTRPVNVSEIPELEKNVYTEDISIREELEGLPLRYEKEYKDVFRNIVIPPGWFKGSRTFLEDEKFFESQRLHFFRREECLGLKSGDVWWRGRIVDMRQGKFGKYFVIFVKHFLGENVATKNMTGAISTKYFSRFLEGQNFLDEIVEFSLSADYIGTGSFNLDIKVINQDK